MDQWHAVARRQRSQPLAVSCEWSVATGGKWLFCGSDRCGVGRHHHERWWSEVASSNVFREHSAANHVRALLPLEQRMLGHRIRSGSPDNRETSRRRFFGDPPDDRRRTHVVQDHFRGASWGAESVRAIVHQHRFHQLPDSEHLHSSRRLRTERQNDSGL